MKNKVYIVDNERRQYFRVNFDSVATLLTEQQSFDCQIIDLSIHGVLLRLHGVHYAKPDAEYTLKIPLNNTNEHPELNIAMQLTLARQKPENMAFRCANLDLDSITHLRKIVELNSGDPKVLERDMQTLCEENQ